MTLFYIATCYSLIDLAQDITSSNFLWANFTIILKTFTFLTDPGGTKSV